MGELDFLPKEYQIATTSEDQEVLGRLSEHPSHYIKARVAGNPHTGRLLRDHIRSTASPSTLLWLIGNQNLTREEYKLIFEEYIGRGYINMVHVALAESRLAKPPELGQLLRLNQWNVTMAVLNNWRQEDREAYNRLLVPYLPEEDIPWEKWSEVEKLAYFRLNGKRRPAQST